jgi:hypothetical protein
MRRSFRSIAAMFALATASAGAWAAGAPRGSTHASFGKASVTIQYGRPSLKGRHIRQMIEPGQLWRAGADAATTIESNVALNFGGTRVLPGKHILMVRFIRPGMWSLVVSKASTLNYTPDSRIAEVLMRLEKNRAPIGELTISLSRTGGNGNIEIAWGAFRLWGEFTPAR